MSGMRPKPSGLGPEYGAQFRDQSVADAYRARPPYPPEVFDILRRLIRDESPVVLDLGCGTGDISRGLAPHVRRIDAVDPSDAMRARGQVLPGGRHPHIHWIAATAEDFVYPDGYALAVTAESMHWMDWHTVLPRIRRSLTSNGRLAIVLGRGFHAPPWAHALGQLITQYSTNRDFEPYDLLTELEARNLFSREDRVQTQPIPFRQTLDEYVESFHSRNGLSRQRMGASAAEFDARLKALVHRHQPQPVLEFELEADLVWGMPADHQASRQ